MLHLTSLLVEVEADPVAGSKVGGCRSKESEDPKVEDERLETMEALSS